MKNKINYTINAPCHPKMHTQRATSSFLYRQMDQDLFLKNLDFTKTESKLLFYKGQKRKISYLQG